MGKVEARSGRVEQEAVVAAATAGDKLAFAALAERYRRELKVAEITAFSAELFPAFGLPATIR